MLLSVIVPVYNEENTIREILKQILSEKTPKEIIVVDDGSTDKTREILAKVKSPKNTKIRIILHKKNMGKGSALRTGFAVAKGDALVVQDADLEYDPKYYETAFDMIISKKGKVVYGSRLMNLKFRITGKRRTPLPLHYIMNRFLTLLTNLLYGAKLTDMETGFKMLSKEVYQKLSLTADRFDIEPEITAKILRQGYKIVEFPIITKPRGYEQGKKIKAKDAIFAIKALFKFRVCYPSAFKLQG